MSDNAPTLTRMPRRLKSPFNGQFWQVPPDADDAMIAEMLRRGFVEVLDDDDLPRATEPRRPRR